MPISLDGHGIFAAIGAHPHAFPDLKSDVQIQAEKLLVKQLTKAKTLEGLTAIFAAIGHANAGNAVDVLNDKQVAALVKKLDKLKAPELDVPASRAHLVKLGLREIAPQAPQPKPRATKAKAPPKGLLESTDAFAEAHVRVSGKAAAPAKEKTSATGTSAPKEPVPSTSRGRPRGRSS